MSLPAVALGIVSSRSRSTRSAVARSEGAVVGVALSTAAVPPELTSGSDTFLTPDVLLDVLLEVLQARVGRGLLELLALVLRLLLDLVELLVELRLDLRLACCLRLGGRHALRLELAGDLLPPWPVACLFALSFWSCSSVESLSRFCLVRPWPACSDRSTLISSGPFAPGPEAGGQAVEGPPRVGALAAARRCPAGPR